jgi:hypothetical protein
MARWPFRPVDLLWWSGLLLLFSLQFWFPVTSGSSNDSYSAGTDGKKALFELFRAFDQPVRRSTTPLAVWCDENRLASGRTAHQTLCVLGTSRLPTQREWDALLGWVERGGRLVFAVSDRHLRQSFGGGFFSSDEEDEDAVIISGERFRTSVQPWRDGPRGVLRSGVWSAVGTRQADWAWSSRGQVEVSGGAVLITSAGSPQAVEYQLGGGQLVLVASDWIFSNQSLSYGDNSVLALRLIAPGNFNRQVVFEESLNRSGTPKVVGLLMEQPFRPATLQLLVVVLLFCWWQSARFGPRFVAATSEHASIVNHTDTVGVLAYHADGGKWALEAYLRQVIRELRLSGPHRKRVLEHLNRLIKRAQQAVRRKSLERKVATELICQLAQMRAAAVENRGRRQAGGLLSRSLKHSRKAASSIEKLEEY